MLPLTRCCESTMLIDCPTAMCFPQRLRCLFRVIPVKTGIQTPIQFLDSRFRRSDVLYHLLREPESSAQRIENKSVISLAIQYPTPLFMNFSRPLGSANDIAGQRMVLPRERRGRVDDHA